MIEKILDLSVRNRWFIVLLTAVACALGVWSLNKLPIDAVPDVTNNQVQINAIAPALIEDTGMLPGPTTELAARVPVGRLGRPEEVADLAMAMLRNPYLTSKVVVLDGGVLPR